MSIHTSQTGRDMECGACGGRTLFEQPPCLDDHDECDEWLCTRCGTAVLAGTTGSTSPVVTTGAGVATAA